MKKSLSSMSEITVKSRTRTTAKKTQTGKTSASRSVRTMQINPYANSLLQIKKLDRAILKITPSSSLRELETYKAQMHRLFSFIEEEKAHLDRSAEQNPDRKLSSDLKKEELGLSDEIDRLKSEALMAGVEADLEVDQLNGWDTDGFVESNGRERLYRCYKNYNHLLENLLKKCRAYKKLVDTF